MRSDTIKSGKMGLDTIKFTGGKGIGKSWFKCMNIFVPDPVFVQLVGSEVPDVDAVDADAAFDGLVEALQ